MLLIRDLNIPGSLLVTDMTSELVRYLSSVTVLGQYWDTFKVNLLESSFISSKKSHLLCYSISGN